MQQSGLSVPSPISSRVRKVAQVIRSFNDAEIAQLVDLVPKLERRQSLAMVRESAERYFRDQLAGQPSDSDEQFIGGLTYGEYLALSETEENAFWDALFADEAMSIDEYEEIDVKRDAYVPAR